MSRPILAQLDLQALKDNLQIVRRAAPGSRVWSVVKANAYGHGIDRIWSALGGTDGFALLNLEEAIQPRSRSRMASSRFSKAKPSVPPSALQIRSIP